MLFDNVIKPQKDRICIKCLILLIFLLSLGILPPYTFPQVAENQKLNTSRVLIVFGPHYGIPTADILLPAITNTLKKGGIQSDHIYVEFLDFFRFPGIRDGSEMVDLLTKKYKETAIDLIIPISQEAVDFVAGELSILSPGAPLLIPGFEAKPAWESKKRPLITMPTELDIEGTLALAIKLFPTAERLVVVSGDDEHSRLFLDSITATAKKFPEFREIIHTADLAYSEMLQFIEDLPSDTIAIFGTYFIDSAGQSYVPAEVAKRTAEQSAVAVFGIRDVHVKNGLVGGSVIISTKLGEQAAETALEFISGELKLNGTDISLKAQHFPLFNWEQLKRFDAETQKLPETTVFFNKPQTLWENHKTELIFAVVILFILLLFLILLNLKNNNLRIALKTQREAEKSLIKSEQNHRLLFETMSPGVVYQAADGKIISANPASEKILGLTFEQMIGKTSMDPRWRMVTEDGRTVPGSEHPAMIALKTGEKVGPVIRGVFNPVEERYVWLSIAAIPLSKPGENKPFKVYATFDDVTDRKEAEDSLAIQLKEKEKLINELSHRTYNNMQVIQALLEYKQLAHPDFSLKQFVNEINGQIRSMAFAHRELQRGEHLSRIDLKEYLKTLVQFVVDRSQEDVKIKMTFDLVPVQVLLDSARPLGLIINELVVNVLNHAFPNNLEKDFTAKLRISSGVSEDGEIDVCISDNGIDWAPSNDPTTPMTGGIGLVIALVKEQLGGTISFDGSNGTTCIITFKDNLYAERV